MTDSSTSSDEWALTKLVARLSSAVDRADREGIIACYAEDSFDDHGRFRGSGRDFAAFVCDDPSSPASDRWVLHCIGQSLFDVNGDEAFGETFYVFYGRGGESTVHQSIGRYVDYFQRINGCWLIKYRRVVLEWDGLVPFDAIPPAGHARGKRNRDDPVYERLKWPTQ